MKLTGYIPSLNLFTHLLAHTSCFIIIELFAFKICVFSDVNAGSLANPFGSGSQVFNCCWLSPTTCGNNMLPMQVTMDKLNEDVRQVAPSWATFADAEEGGVTKPSLALGDGARYM